MDTLQGYYCVRKYMAAGALIASEEAPAPMPLMTPGTLATTIALGTISAILLSMVVALTVRQVRRWRAKMWQASQEQPNGALALGTFRPKFTVPDDVLSFYDKTCTDADALSVTSEMSSAMSSTTSTIS